MHLFSLNILALMLLKKTKYALKYALSNAIKFNI